MKILSVTAQKPNSTGSGVYLTELMKEFEKLGHKQAIVAGISMGEEIALPFEASVYPVQFMSKDLPFPVCGMSDEMPYTSTRYKDMTREMVFQFKSIFLRELKRAMDEFCPDLIFCHHLYLLTAIVREAFPEKKIYGFCHNTDLRQMQSHPLGREFIKSQIKKLDGIYVLREEQIELVEEIYEAERKKISVVGMGYNADVFFDQKKRVSGKRKKILFAGKITQKKGVVSLLRAMHLMKEKNVELELAGGSGNAKEYQEILSLGRGENITFLGKLNQMQMADAYNQSDIFVLPSFYEGIPLTVIEAMACGNRVVMTDLPGVQKWINQNIENPNIDYVKMPKMYSIDEPDQEALPKFEEELARVLDRAVGSDRIKATDLSRVSWRGVAQKVLGGCKNDEFKTN